MLKSIALGLSLLLASNLLAKEAPILPYSVEKAAIFEGFYKNFTQEACAKGALFVSAEDAMKMISEKKDVLFLDIRTPGEVSVVSLRLDNSLEIPIEVLFKKENLDKLPTDKKIVIVCYSGTRAGMAATGLMMSGIKNVLVLKGGIKALAEANTPATAPMK